MLIGLVLILGSLFSLAWGIVAEYRQSKATGPIAMERLFRSGWGPRFY